MFHLGDELLVLTLAACSFS